MNFSFKVGKQVNILLRLSQDSNFPPLGRAIMPRPAMCHTSSLQTPNDKAQALQVSVSYCISFYYSFLTCSPFLFH